MKWCFSVCLIIIYLRMDSISFLAKVTYPSLSSWHCSSVLTYILYWSLQNRVWTQSSVSKTRVQWGMNNNSSRTLPKHWRYSFQPAFLREVVHCWPREWIAGLQFPCPTLKLHYFPAQLRRNIKINIQKTWSGIFNNKKQKKCWRDSGQAAFLEGIDR